MRREIRVTIYERVRYSKTWRRQSVVNSAAQSKRDSLSQRRSPGRLSTFLVRKPREALAEGQRPSQRPRTSVSLRRSRSSSREILVPEQSSPRRLRPDREGQHPQETFHRGDTLHRSKKRLQKNSLSARACRDLIRNIGKEAEKGKGLVFVDDVTTSILRRFFEFLVDGEEDDDGPANHPFTAAMKVMRISSFVRHSVLSRVRGQSPRRTTSVNSRAAESLRFTAGKIWTRCSPRWMRKSI